MRLLLDEMHAPAIAGLLAEESFDVIAVAADAALRGLSDEDLLIHAAAHERAVVTENVADFMPLATRWSGENRAHAGLVFTHPRRFSRATVAYPGNLVAALREFLTDPPVAGASWVWWL